MTKTKDSSNLPTRKIGKSCLSRRLMLIKRKGRKYSMNNYGSPNSSRRSSSGFGFLRRSVKGSNNHTSHFICKAVLLLIILEGLGCGSGGTTMLVSAQGASSSSSTGSNNGGSSGGGWQSNQYQQQQSTFGGSGDENAESDNRGGGGNSGDSFISTLATSRAEAARRMRDRCGRYSLLKVLQQWETMQRRCRLSVRNILSGNSVGGSESNNSNAGPVYQYYEEDPMDRYDLVAPSKPTSEEEDGVHDSGNRIIDKRSRHHYYSAIGKLRVNNNDEDDDVFRNYYYEVNGDALESCCPVVFEVIAPVYGRNRSGHMVELYKDENVQQRFNEYRCHKDYLERPCRFVESQYRRISKCVQQYLDTYALVRSDDSKTGWSMEHIRVASGCACKVDPASKRRKKVSLAQRNQRRSQRIRGNVAGDEFADMYNFGSTLLKRRNSKRKSFQQLINYPQFPDY